MPNEDDLADAPAASEDARLTRLATICAAFPEVERERMGVHSRFVVRKKTFVYFLKIPTATASSRSVSKWFSARTVN